VLEEVQAFLERLQGRRRATSWLLAVKDKERFAELNAALDRALAVFCVRLSSIKASEVLEFLTDHVLCLQTSQSIA
jgi:hypothetical protein